MAQFTMDLAGINGDTKKIESYLIKLNRNLEYMFSHLTPEDNYSKDAYDRYIKDGENASLIEQNVDQIKLQMLTSDNVVSAINLSREGVTIQGDKISLEGVVTMNGYFRVGLDGSIEARNARFSGDITASTIAGSEISVGGLDGTGAIVVYDDNGDNIGQWDHEGISIFKGDISLGFFTVSEDTAIFGPFHITSYDSETGRYVMESENSDIGFSNGLTQPGQLWIWAGYDSGTDTYKFQVNNSGQVWANDFCIRGGYTSISDELDAIWEAIGELHTTP